MKGGGGRGDGVVKGKLEKLFKKRGSHLWKYLSCCLWEQPTDTGDIKSSSAVEKSPFKSTSVAIQDTIYRPPLVLRAASQVEWLRMR